MVGHCPEVCLNYPTPRSRKIVMAAPLRPVATAVAATVGYLTPTLFIAGSEECLAVDLKAADARTPKARGRLIPRFGHLQTFWHSGITAPAITDFVTTLPGYS